ncbi:hypothetical protein BDY21DRAFT_281395 [Lineolata rhizophorae]|uniref:D-isomer specific 2-hydroxyacid dehydrogenase NAD-binding domain-containing protein n=1 Tax=Lineolata rhizophorae TaxID=578093 RepID=A0A6A6P6S8_9PEZI|nr:hypothetical protein BDY21DRAFT_281395 [Lineolata rhizophorae]
MGGGPEAKKDKVLFVLPFPEPTDVTDRLKRKFPNIDFEYINLTSHRDGVWVRHKELPKEIYHDITILGTLAVLPEKPEDCPRLELTHIFSAGINHITDNPVYKDTDVTFTTSNGIHGPQIAEWVVMTALIQSHKYNPLYELQKQHKWGQKHTSENYGKVSDLVGQRLGVLGYGSIGRQVARVGKAMGMDVIAYTAHAKDTPAARADNGYIVPGTGDPDGSIPSAWYSGTTKAELHRFLAQDVDLLLVSVPLTKATLRLLGAAEFAVLGRRNAFVTNISRGKVVDQPALVDALKDGTLRGAALDVVDPEPLPEDDPLWDAPNVTITPHISGLGDAYAKRAFEVMELNLERRANGEELINVVDKKRGY